LLVLVRVRRVITPDNDVVVNAAHCGVLRYLRIRTACHCTAQHRTHCHNKSSTKSFRNSRVATPHGRECTRLLRVLAYCSMPTADESSLSRWYAISTSHRQTHIPFQSISSLCKVCKLKSFTVTKFILHTSLNFINYLANGDLLNSVKIGLYVHCTSIVIIYVR